MVKEIIITITVAVLHVWSVASCLHLAILSLLLWNNNKKQGKYNLYVGIGLIIAIILPLVRAYYRI